MTIKRLLPVLISTLMLTSCGVFIKSPTLVNPHNEALSESLSRFYKYSDGSINYLDLRIKSDQSPIVVAIHGLGAHAGSFTYLQDYLDEQRISSISMDLRGFGHWNGKKGDLENLGMHVSDVIEILELVEKSYPNRQIVLLGESLGSSLSLWVAQHRPDLVDGVVVTSLVTKSGGKVSLGTIFRLLAGYTFAPRKPVKLSYDPTVYSQDSTFLQWAFNEDTLGARRISPRYLVQANRVIKKSRKNLCELKTPLLIIQGGKDFLSTQKKLNQIIMDCDSDNIEYTFFPDMLHSIVNDSDRNKAFDSIRNWILNLDQQ